MFYEVPTLLIVVPSVAAGATEDNQLTKTIGRPMFLRFDKHEPRTEKMAVIELLATSIQNRIIIFSRGNTQRTLGKSNSLTKAFRTMKITLISTILLIFTCLTQPAMSQGGFTNKSDAKNITMNGLKEGKWVEYEDEEGGLTQNADEAVLYILTEYKDGKPVGLVRYYYTSGKISDEVPYVNAKQNGLGKVVL